MLLFQPSVRILPLSQGLNCLIDAEDFERVDAWHWFPRRVDPQSDKYYAFRSTRLKGRAHSVYLHRLLIDAPPGAIVDHVNGDTLDCRKANLRLCSLRENAINSRRLNRSGFRGVYASGNGWFARIQDRGLVYELGYHAEREAAAAAYNLAAEQLHGAIALLNDTDAALSEESRARVSAGLASPRKHWRLQSGRIA